ncbi:hypothetical protein CVD28_18560 [Bacillus sp. M6-12]|uniref:hypothetical protein n=1 Tax=Bacillus sp. M6-12 TaxID=2054166 RepID=UPI000C762296|nr:hypothetical protein [Bacillus sp. M6-12]PLS16052.1 hypothetical protein CVD28_18560 [Bacillus sp. M6-12]
MNRLKILKERVQVARDKAEQINDINQIRTFDWVLQEIAGIENDLKSKIERRTLNKKTIK